MSGKNGNPLLITCEFQGYLGVHWGFRGQEEMSMTFSQCLPEVMLPTNLASQRENFHYVSCPLGRSLCTGLNKKAE
ncbi:hypothetical protein CEXT_513911 [Caerostris extrusa]|uniref:Uncharacterized protein n=1 Tax=Caerostris extrusa TaxID=172846 RepID=A0AAV4V3Y7_CAEEX|nr:hypothetical protein CEXT_513911 [Caerostris extrusa]